MKRLTVKEMKEIGAAARNEDGCPESYMGCTGKKCCIQFNCGPDSFLEVCGSYEWYINY